MNTFKNIFWHDTVIFRIEEDCETNTVIFHVNYPRNWEKNLFERGTIVFNDCIIDSVETIWAKPDAPVLCTGYPEIMAVDLIEQRDMWTKLRVTTNQWTRTFWCKEVVLNCLDENIPAS